MTEQMQEILLGLVGGSQLEIINEDKPIPFTAEELRILELYIRLNR